MNLVLQYTFFFIFTDFYVLLFEIEYEKSEFNAGRRERLLSIN